MPDIDISAIRPGDAVRVSYQSESMRDAGVPPVEFETTTYARWGRVLAAGMGVDAENVTILEHTPARPAWADALVVLDGAGIPFGNVDGSFVGLGGGRSGEKRDPRDIQGPVAVVLDADCNPPTPEPEWLDADALRDLPEEAIVLPRDRKLPRAKFDGKWVAAGHNYGFDADTIAPARELWNPEADR